MIKKLCCNVRYTAFLFVVMLSFIVMTWSFTIDGACAEGISTNTTTNTTNSKTIGGSSKTRMKAEMKAGSVGTISKPGEITKPGEIKTGIVPKIVPKEDSKGSPHNPKSDPSKLRVGVQSADIGVTLGGVLNMQFGNASQEAGFSKAEGAPNICLTDQCDQKQSGLITKGELIFDAFRDSYSGLDYGIHFRMNVNPSKNSNGSTNVAKKVFGYVQGVFGRLEVGSNDGASTLLKVSPISFARATGGIDGDFSDWLGSAAYKTSDSSRTNLKDLFTNDAYLPYTSDQKRTANKVTYITPEVHGLSFGVSVIPNTRVVGTTDSNNNFSHGAYRNVLNAAVKYSNNISEKLNFAASLSGEMGSADDVLYTVSKTETQQKAREPLNAWEVGGQFKYSGFTVGGAFGDANKSGMLQEGVLDLGMHKQNHFWTAGAAYVHGKLGASVTYLQSTAAGKIATIVDSTTLATQFVGYQTISSNTSGGSSSGANGSSLANKCEAWSFGVDYQVIPGFLPYAEITFFKYKSPIPEVKTNSGNVVLIGGKLSF